MSNMTAQATSFQYPTTEELADPFRPPSDSIPPVQDEEKLAPDTGPAPAPHPDTLSEAHGFPRERRCTQE